MDADDLPVGRMLTRREILGLLGGAAVAACAPGAVSATPAATGTARDLPTALGQPATASPVPVATPSCVVVPALTEGPYYIDTALVRSDIRTSAGGASEREGARLELAFQVARAQAGSCTALAGAVVDVWHCDAAGAYSGVSDGQGSARGETWLRGVQRTDQNGLARFVTVYPGWYPGRAVHIHFKVATVSGGRTSEVVSQLFFDEALTDRVYATAPYARRGGAGRTRNESDGIFRQSGGRTLLEVRPSGSAYTATFAIGVVT